MPRLLTIALAQAFFLATQGALLADLLNPPTITNSIGMHFELIQPGTFTMGAGPNFIGEALYERPAHTVTLTKAYYIGVTEVTQAQWQIVMGSKTSSKSGDKLPVDNVSYEDALEFIAKLNQMEGNNSYRLPTEAEWEYAARAGSNGNYCFGDDPQLLEEYAWYNEDFHRGKLSPVGTKRPNTWGLFDMHGSLFEWTADFFSENYYSSSPARDPKGPEAGETKVTRGGSWASDAWFCQVATRNEESPRLRSLIVGLRVVKDPY
ncbi:MAG: formylglycine-generating enzyme family protein [Deltaproteobacteria bacterium]|jgi:formylglycine-generating enzyme required for sulfatase activity|nr:formylglycine-generating enzyme family protein [Deltaproteobacteria bacterium]